MKDCSNSPLHLSSTNSSILTWMMDVTASPQTLSKRPVVYLGNISISAMQVSASDLMFDVGSMSTI